MTEGKLLWVLQSRKFWAALIGLILILVTTWGQNPYPTDAVVTAVMGVVGAYVASVAYEDSQQAKAQATVDVAKHMAAGVVAAANVTATQPTPPAVGIDANNVNVTTTDATPPATPTLGNMG